MSTLPKIYVDGQEGTTGLRIHQLLSARKDLELLRIDEAQRKDLAERKRLLNAADLAFLCLPDAASREAVALIDPANTRTKIIDASTAFRTDPAWAFGIPELSPSHRQKIKTATRIANPGCHSTAFLLSVAPLVAHGLLASDAHLTCFSLTGYSGGGKKMIASYEAPDRPQNLKAPRPYALKMTHKHLPEMQNLGGAVGGLTHAPYFIPVVADIYAGMAVTIFLPPAALSKKSSPQQLAEALAKHYANEPFIKVLPFDPEFTAAHFDAGSLDITTCNNTNRADIFVIGHDAQSAPGTEPQLALICRLDNLGKGASGAAIQSMNLALGFPETTGLER